MTKLSELKKELKTAEKQIKKNKNIEVNKDLAEILRNEIKAKENLRKKGYKTKTLNKILDKFEKYNPKMKHLQNIKYVGNEILRFRFDRDKFTGNTYSVKEVQKISNEFSEYMKKKGLNGKIMTSMNYGILDWRSGKFSDIGEDVNLYTPADSGIEMEIIPQIKSFVIYSVIKPKAQGGTDHFNDCLYNCIKQVIIRIEDYWESPEAFKKFLGVKNRCDKVPVNNENIEKVEKKLRNFQINIRGDFVYSSTVKSDKVINLNLSNQHFTVEKPTKKPLVRFINFYEKPIMLYDKLTFEGYDGNIKRILSKEEANEIKYDFKSKYILVERELQKDEKGNNIVISIEEEYDKLIPVIDKLKEASGGLINLYKSGSYKNASLNLFDSFTKFLNEPEEIQQDEANWIYESSIGALIWAEEYEGELYKYDVKSLYPYLMTSTTLKFPIKRGEFQKLDKFGDFFQYGIYRCKILKSSDESINKLFRFNQSNYYTAISLTHAKTLGLTIELIQDDKPNFLYYSRDKLITFNEVFKPFVEFMFELKEKKIEKSKQVLNILWGALCEIDKKKYFCEETKEINISDDEEIFEIRPYKNDEEIDIISTHKNQKRYKTNYARLNPFLVSQGRLHMSNLLLPYKDNIHRIQTDGFLSDIKIHQNKEVKLGELKYEGFTEKGVIKNCLNKVEVHY
jgi:hypothetical protein